MPNTDKELFMIKPLEWVWREMVFSHAHVATPILGFSALVAVNKKGEWYWQTSTSAGNYCASPEEGKQLAESHWNEYIKQALVEVQP